MPRLLLALAVLATACASHNRPATTATPATPPSAPPSPPAAPPAPPRASSEVVRLGPSALRYVSHQVVHVDQKMQGMQQANDFGLRSFFRVTISGPADSTGYATTMTVDSIVPDSGSTLPPGINLTGVKGLSITGRLTPSGEFRNSVASDTTALAPTLAQVISSFRNFFPRLPTTGATLGAAWTDTVTSNERAIGNVAVTNISHVHAAAWEQRNGVRCLRLDVTSSGGKSRSSSGMSGSSSSGSTGSSGTSDTSSTSTTNPNTSSSSSTSEPSPQPKQQ